MNLSDLLIGGNKRFFLNDTTSYDSFPDNDLSPVRHGAHQSHLVDSHQVPMYSLEEEKASVDSMNINPLHNLLEIYQFVNCKNPPVFKTL